MALIPWEPDPEPFGNAGGFDTVALDVQIRIAERMGMTVLVGRFPDDVQAEQEAMTPLHRDEPTPLKTITISHDGLAISGHYNGHRSISGYRSSYWLEELTPETVVFDIRSVPWDSARRFAVRGPLLGVDLPAGMVSKFGDFPSYMEGVADDYMRSVGASLEEVKKTR